MTSSVEGPPLVLSPDRAIPSQRNDTIDLIRILAACGVIWFHLDSAPFRRVGYAGLVFFLIISVVYLKRGAERGRRGDFFRKRATRLLIPWAAWFAIYGFIRIASNRSFFPEGMTLLSGCLSGPWIALWFLPYSFISAAVVFALVRLLTRFPSVNQFALFGALSLLSLIFVCFVRSFQQLPVPYAQWLHAAPSIPIGLAFASAWEQSGRRRGLLFLAQALLTIACLAIYPIDSGLAISFGVGSLLVSIGLLFPRQLPAIIGRASSLCLGVYLVHGAVIDAFRFLPFVFDREILCFCLTATTSFVLIAMARRIPHLSKFI